MPRAEAPAPARTALPEPAPEPALAAAAPARRPDVRFRASADVPVAGPLRYRVATRPRSSGAARNGTPREEAARSER